MKIRIDYKNLLIIIIIILDSSNYILYIINKKCNKHFYFNLTATNYIQINNKYNIWNTKLHNIVKYTYNISNKQMYKIKYIIYNTSALSFYLKVSEFCRSIINTYIYYLRERETTTKKNYTKK
jgi:hypothetical protein